MKAVFGCIARQQRISGGGCYEENVEEDENSDSVARTGMEGSPPFRGSLQGTMVTQLHHCFAA
jgi:hypothetical protein